MKPRFQHDCKWCEFLGVVGEYDVYLCPQNGNPTIVARYGRKGEEYFSGQRLVLGKLILEMNLSALPA